MTKTTANHIASRTGTVHLALPGGLIAPCNGKSPAGASFTDAPVTCKKCLRAEARLADAPAAPAKRQAKPDPKPAAKKRPKARKVVDEKSVAKARREVEAAARESVWQDRVNAAVDALNGGAESAPLHECPTPKTATGTADKVRKMIATGKLSVPVAITVKSHGPYVEARLS